MRPSDYFVVFLVDARRLDYSDDLSFIRTLAKHPSDGSKNGDVGHAWIYLEGNLEGQRVYLEGGHTYALEGQTPEYLEGISYLVEEGHPDPASYLWYVRPDGFFEQGNGGHKPTYAAKVDLTEEQFLELAEWIENYPYDTYSLLGPQCATVAAEVADRIGLKLETEVTLKIDQNVTIRGVPYCFWENPKYSSITFSSPDRLERSLMRAVQAGDAEYALIWYLNKRLVIDF